MLTLSLDRPAEQFCHDAMNCTFTFLLEGVDARYAAQAALAAWMLVDRLEDLLSLYREHSDVSRINAAQDGELLRISDEAVECLAVAMQVSALTGAAFHPFCGAHALKAKGQAPADTSAAAAMGDALVLELDVERSWVVKRQAGPVLDLGGIGKGHALDLVARLLQEEWEIPAGLLIAGGSSVLAFGDCRFAPWPLRLVDGIALPGLSQAALGCSGFGFQPHHIIDPATAEPVDNKRRACVHAPGAALADALATAAIATPWNRLEAVFGSLEAVSLLIDDIQPTRIGPFFQNLPPERGATLTKPIIPSS